MVPNITPIMENQMEKKMENEMEAGIIQGFYCQFLGAPCPPSSLAFEVPLVRGQLQTYELN